MQLARKGLVSGVVVGLLSAGFFIGWLRTKTGSLLDISRRVGDASPWVADRWIYAWAGTNELLVLREVNQGDFAATIINLETGKEKVLPALTPLLSGHERMSDVFEWRLSPDGREFFLASGPAGQVTEVAIRCDGSAQLGYVETNGWLDQIWWLPKSRVWATFAQSPGRLMIRTFDLANRNVSVQEWPQNRRLPAGRARGFGADDEMLSFDRDQMAVVSVDLEGSSPPRRHPIALPASAVCRAIIVSPRADLLAWWVTAPRGMPRLRLKNAFPFVNVTRPMRDSLWVSRADGSRLHEIGSLESGQDLFSPVWLPDGGHLSFLSDGVLWKVAVPTTEPER